MISWLAPSSVQCELAEGEHSFRARCESNILGFKNTDNLTHCHSQVFIFLMFYFI